jgi:hypothetical protein
MKVEERLIVFCADIGAILPQWKGNQMKKIFLLAIISSLLILSGIHNSYAGGTLKVGIDYNGKEKESFYGTADVKTNVSLSGELLGAIGKNFDIGAGVSYQVPREFENYSGEFYFIPIYAVARIKFGNQRVSPYLTGQIGYNFFDGDSDYKEFGSYAADTDGGLYYGFGGGIIFNRHFLIELLYTVDEGTLNIPGDDIDVRYSKFTLNFGFNF